MSEPTNEQMIGRVNELIDAITGNGRFTGVSGDRRMTEFYMSIPAEPHKDADLVISTLIRRFSKVTAQRDALASALNLSARENVFRGDFATDTLIGYKYFVKPERDAEIRDIIKEIEANE